ncbi:MAG: galactosyltransferase-related protein [Planctomycetota bacterium]
METFTPDNPDRPAVHVVIPTHTPRYLDLVLAAIALQTAAPASVVVACDTDDPAIADLVDTVWPQLADAAASRDQSVPRLVHVGRPHQGEARLNQNRNNGLRTLEKMVRPGERDLVVFVDGDTLLAEDAIDRYQVLASEGTELVIPYRIDLDRETSEALCLDDILRGDRPLGHLATARAYERLEVRERRYTRQLRQREGLEQRVGLIKPHKPKVLGGHHAVSVGRLRAVNGFDERYTGWGFDDDELARRLHAMRPAPRCAIAVRTILAFHIWHESRAPKRLSDSPGYRLFNERPFPRLAERGWARPVDQPEPTAREVLPASIGTATPRA